MIAGEPINETLEFHSRFLIKSLIDPDKDFLYRLSIVGDNFSRELALDIAEISPEIHNPGESLSNLIGPWLDKLENGEYCVTPLLQKTGRDNLKFVTQQAVHRLVVKKLTSNNIVEGSKASNVLTHLWSANDYQEFAQVLFLLLMSVKTKDQAKYIDWATAILFGVPWPEEFDLNWRINIRASQVRLSALAGGNIYELNNDLSALLEIANPEENLFSILFALITTGTSFEELPPEVTIPRSFTLLQFINANRSSMEEYFDEDLIENLPNTVWVQGMRANGRNHTELFVDELAKLSEESKELLFTGSYAVEASTHLTDQIWYSEILKSHQEQDWQSSLSLLNEIEQLPVIQNCPLFRVACARSRAVIYSDYLNDREKAIEALNGFSDINDPDSVFIISYSKGCLFSDMGSVQSAIPFFIRADESKSDTFSHYRLDNMRRHAIEQSRNQDWGASQQLCVTVIKQFSNPAWDDFYLLDRLEMFGELAYIHWSTGRWDKACATLFGYIMGLINFQGEETPRFIEVFNKAGHGLGWFLSIAETGKPPTQIADGSVYAAVQPGLFGIRRDNLGKVIPPVGFSRAILLMQLARLAKAIGLLRIAWKVNKLSLEYYQRENRDKNLGVELVLSDLALLESLFGDIGVAMEYAYQSINLFAAGKVLSRSGKVPTIIQGNSLVEHISIVSEEDCGFR